MTLQVWPSSIPGVTIAQTRAYQWKTAIAEALSGKEARLQLAQYPRIKFTLTFELLRDNLTVSELRTLQGLFNNSAGQYQTFLYTDPSFNSVTAQQFGTGDGTTSSFQLTAVNEATGGIGATEIIQFPNGAISVYVNGTLQTLTTAYTVSSLGVVTFTSGHIPASGAVITWSGSFYYLVRFDEDDLEFTQFMNQWWQTKAIPLMSVRL